MAVKWEKVGYTLDRLPIHQRVGTSSQTPTFTSILSDLYYPVNLVCMFLDCGRRLEKLNRTYVDTERTYKPHTERSWLGTESELSYSELQMLTTVSLCYPLIISVVCK